MGRANETSEALRPIKEGEALLFAAWEAAERSYPWSTAQFEETRQLGAVSRTFVFESEEEVLGYAVMSVAEDEVYLSNIMVTPRRRRAGIGAKILQKVIMWAAEKRARVIALDVDTANEAAVRLYTKLGFEIVQRRKSSYPKGEDAFVMRKKI